MGTLYSCILKAISTVYGPGGPDTGGPTDPDDCVTGAIGACCNGVGEGCDPPGDDCDIEITVYFCTYLGGEGNCSVQTDTFTKGYLVGQGGLGACSDSVGIGDSFDIGGITYYTDPGAIVSCCSPFIYFTCGERPPCGFQHTGCSDTTEVDINIAPGGVQPDTWDIGGTTGYTSQGLCKAGNGGCCVSDPPPVTIDPNDPTTTTFTGGGDLECRCKLQSPPTVVHHSLSPAGFRKVATFTQECDRAEPGDVSDNGDILSDWGDSAGNPTMICTSEGYTGVLWKDCKKTDGSLPCTGPCGDLVYTIKCVPGVCVDHDDAAVEDALITSYSHINEPYNDPNNPGWVVCPSTPLVFQPVSGPLLEWINDPNINTTLSITGGLGSQINQNGVISMAAGALNNASEVQTLIVTLDTECGGTTSTGVIELYLDPTDLTICSDYGSCEGLPNNCGFDDQNVVTQVKIIQQHGFPPGPDIVQFDAPPGGQAYLTEQAAIENTAWQYCSDANPNYSTIYLETRDAQGDPVDIDVNNNSITLTPFVGGVFDFTLNGILTVGPGRKRLVLINLTGDAIDNENSGQPFAILNFPNGAHGTKTLDLRCTTGQGTPPPGFESYPLPTNCGLGLPGQDSGASDGELKYLSTKNTLRNFRASYATRQASRGSAQKDYLEGLSRRRSSEVLFDPVTSNETYAPKRLLPFIPYKPRTMYYRNIFSKIIDYRIHLIREYYDSPNDATDYSESIFQDLTLKNIHQSLTKEFRVKVNNLKNPDGTPLKNTILGKIRYLIIKDQLGSFNISDINNMGTLTKEVDPGLVTGPSFTALKEIIATVNKSKSLNPLEYRGVGAQRIRRWKTIASDLSKNLPIIEEDLSVEQLFVHDTDLIDFALSDGTSTSVPITDFDEINFIKADGTQSTLNLDTQIHRSKVMDFEDLTNSFKKINDTFNIKLTASSAAVAKIEEDASLSSNRSSEYVFKLDSGSLTDLDRRNPIVRLTSCNYDLMTDPIEIEDWTKNKVYPFYSFYINHTDLFLDHMEKKKQLNAEYKDISFDSFASSESEDFAVIPRRIPWYIVVIPTDRNDLLTSIGASKLVDYQTRVISFKLSSKTSDYKQNYSSPIMDENQSDYFLNTATGQEYFDYFTYKYNDSKVKDTIKPFKMGYEILPRPEPSTRALFKAIRGVVADGNEFVERNSDTITWGSVYQRMSKQDKKSVSLVDSFNFSDLKSKFLLGKISSNDTINAEFGKVKDSVNSGIKNISKYVPTTAKKMTIEKLVEDSVEEFPGG